jgi:hypothetical protein
LQFVITEECTATLTDQDLELADHFYPTAIMATGLTPPVIDRLADVRRQIQSAIRWRATDAAAQTATDTQQHQDQPPRPPQEPPGRDGGSRVPIAPRPHTQPPSGAAADQFTDVAAQQRRRHQEQALDLNF